MSIGNKTQVEELSEQPAQLEPGELIVGTITGLGPEGEALVEFAQNPSGHGLVAISTVAITRRHVGRSAALMFENGALDRPVIIGLIHSPLLEMIDNFELTVAETEGQSDQGSNAIAEIPDKALIDGKKVMLEGSEQIVLKCGESSITLTHEGKITIRGKYLLNRASGVNRILGGSVQVN